MPCQRHQGVQRVPKLLAAITIGKQMNARLDLLADILDEAPCSVCAEAEPDVVKHSLVERCNCPGSRLPRLGGLRV